MITIKYLDHTFKGTGDDLLLLNPTAPPEMFETWDPISEALAWDVLTFGVKSDATGSKYIWTSLSEIYSTSSNEEYLIDDGDLMDYTRGTPVRVYKDGAFLREFYLDNITARDGGIFEISAVSAVGLLAERYHRGGVYFGAVAGDVIADIMDGMAYDIDGDVAEVTVYGWLPYDTARANLSRVLFATGASLMKNAAGEPWIRFNQPIGSTDVSAATYYERSAEPVPQFGTIRVIEHTFFDSAAQTEKVLFDNRNSVAAASALIIFEEPMAATRADGLTRESWGANWAIVSGTGVLYGTPYVHIQRILEEETGINSSEVYETGENALVSRLNSSTVLERLVNYYSNAVRYTISTKHSTERTGNIITFPNVRGVTESGYISTMDSVASSFVKSTMEVITRWTPKGLGNQYNDYFIVTAAPGGQITIPAAHRGKKALAVLFSGAQGGAGGYNGKSGSRSRYLNEDTEPDRVTSKGYGGEGGEGGAPGMGGGPGRYLLADIESLAATYTATIGAGGAGGAHNGEAGEIGGDTVLGDFTTADGVVPEGPYINMIDGTVYGEQGDPGVAGKRGGKGGNLLVIGSAGEAGENGEDFNTLWKGGKGGLGFRYHHYDTVSAGSGGGGGGAAYGSGAADAEQDTKSYNPPTAGANASAPAKAGFYRGGTGGNGGGGGGGGGHRYSGDYVSRGAGAAGGLGSVGGQGADGFILFYV